MDNVSVRASFGCFVDRRREPGLASVRKALAGARAAWDDLEAHLAEQYGLKGSFHFMYGQRYGWALRFQRSGRLVLAMYPNHDHLTVQIILGRTQVATATAMTLPLHIVKVIESAKDYPEGKWLFIPVRSGKSAKEPDSSQDLSADERRQRESGEETGREWPSNERVKLKWPVQVAASHTFAVKDKRPFIAAGPISCLST